ncbi:hypothetical protein K3495_g7196 [Podosphaera aphanis]|nr:hypothetical protein K3495_g7196 [Podosphaera aphanis]
MAQMSLALDGFTPDLPPYMASMQDKSADEIIADLQNSPMFMTEIVENDDLEALRALAYEGTTLEIASGFKDRGNECFKEKGWKDAKEFYTKAIDVILLEVRKRQRDEKSDAKITESEKKREIHVLEVCLVNRAACHLELRNYRSCCQDCGSALRINPNNIKAYYRSSKACLALDRVPEADNSCTRGLAVDPDNASLRSLKAAVMQRSKLITVKKQKEIERREKMRLARIALDDALRARNFTLRKTGHPPEMEDARIALTDPLDITSPLCFPTLLLYPRHFQTDFIKAFDETQSISDHLAYIFPLPWDRDSLYTDAGVVCYIETVTGGLLKVGKKVTLKKVLAANIEIVDELVKIFVLPQADSATWVTEFKQKKVADK